MDTAHPPKQFSILRFWPLLIVGAAIGIFFASGLNKYLTLDALKQNREALLTIVAAQGPVAIAGFIALYAASTALSLPLGLLLTLTGGFLFGALWGTAYVVTGATIGATVLFIVAKTAFGDALRARFGPTLQKMEAGFAKDAFNYLLVLRLIPVFPFFVVNLAPALLGVRLSTFVGATLIGIIPGSFVYASIGNGLGAVFDAGKTPDLSLFTKPEVIGPLLGLAVLAILPVLYRRFAAKDK